MARTFQSFILHILFRTEQTEQEEKEKAYREHERLCKSYLPLANEVVDMFAYVSKAVPGSFVSPELVDRLAAMLDYNLKQLAGPECQNLKVEHPERYKFDPRKLFNTITDIFLNLMRAV